MTRIKLSKWDVIDQLRTEQDMALYLEACLEENDPELLVVALDDIARARGARNVGRVTDWVP